MIALIAVASAQRPQVATRHWKLPKGAVLKSADSAKSPARRMTYVVPGPPAESIRFFEAQGMKNQFKGSKNRAIFNTPEGMLVVTMSSYDFGSKGRVSGPMAPKGKHFLEIVEKSKAARVRTVTPK